MRLRGRNRDRIEVCCSVDEAWVPHMAAMLQSLFVNEPQPVRVHVLATDLAQESVDRLRELADANGNEITVVEPDLERVASMPAVVAPVLWYRVFIGEALAHLDRVICIDTDVLFSGSILPLWQTELDATPLAAVATVFPGREWGARHCEPLGLAPADYFNNGVTVLDLERLRQEGISEQIAEYAVAHEHRMPPASLKDAQHSAFVDYARDHPERLLIAEQDLTNAVIRGRWKRLHPRWNCMLQVGLRPLSDEVFGSRAVDEALAEPVIRHYEGGGSAKPWHADADPDAAALYLSHRNRTPWSLEPALTAR